MSHSVAWRTVFVASPARSLEIYGKIRRGRTVDRGDRQDGQNAEGRINAGVRGKSAMTVAVETRRLSFEEYCQLDDSDRRYELVNGELRLMNPPIARHFLIAKFLERAFDNEIQRLQQPWTCLQGAGVRTGLAKSRLPDLMVLPTEAVMELLDRSAVFQTPPFLAVEIVSPSSSVDDYRYKRSEYGAIEIPEYWIVDGRDRKVTVLHLDEGFYEETVYADDEAIASKLFPELDVTTARIFAIGGK
ncbi:hypothetical protein CKA32_006428 [Geitlerinema sp. FC II]|nr:hypothetical protein CKA32_006428 [Geitlerinema sp. FC II]